MAVYFFMALGARGLFSFFASFPLFGLVTPTMHVKLMLELFKHFFLSLTNFVQNQGSICCGFFVNVNIVCTLFAFSASDPQQAWLLCGQVVPLYEGNGQTC